MMDMSQSGKVELSETKRSNKSERVFKGKSLMELPTSYVVVDIETTGLSTTQDVMIEIGAIRYIEGKEIQIFSELIRPNSYYVLDDEALAKTEDYCMVDGKAVQYISKYISSLTGIKNKMLEDAKEEKEVLERFHKFLGDATIVGHNVNFDINFLYDASMRQLELPLKNDFIDTMRLSRKLLKGLERHRLKDLAEYYGLDREGAHRAVKDCYMTNGVLSGLRGEILEQFGDMEAYLKTCSKYARKDSTNTVSKILVKEREIDETHPLYRKVCVFSGKLEGMTRPEAEQIVESLGGINGKSITGKTNYLILGNNDYCSLIKDGKSSKQKKAEKLKLEGNEIEIITEEVFYDMLEQ